MSDRLPPLTALRAFEAAARHLSFSRAADELAVTPAALSFQIRGLEERYGGPLFRRLARSVELTEAGRVLAEAASEGFGTLERGWRAARRLADDSTLTVTAGPAFTAKWLAPRLFAFARAHPKIDLRFSASLRLVDLERDDVDVAIRFGLGSDEGLASLPLMDEWMTPMLAPSLADGVRRPEDLLRLPLIEPDDIAFLDPVPNWAAWFAAAGVRSPAVVGPRFNQSDHALDAAEAGAGVVLGRISLAAAALAERRLVAPFALSLKLSARFRALCLPSARTRPAVAAFLEWLRAETAAVAALSANREMVSPGRRS